MVEADAGEFGDRDGQDGEIDAADAKAERQITDEGAGGGRDRHRHGKADPRPDAEMHVERRRGIGPQADIERVAERQLPGKAHHDVPGLPGIGEVENKNKNGEKIIADRKSTRLNSSHSSISYAVFCLKKKK